MISHKAMPLTLSNPTRIPQMQEEDYHSGHLLFLASHRVKLPVPLDSLSKAALDNLVLSMPDLPKTIEDYAPKSAQRWNFGRDHSNHRDKHILIEGDSFTIQYFGYQQPAQI